MPCVVTMPISPPTSTLLDSETSADDVPKVAASTPANESPTAVLFAQKTVGGRRPSSHRRARRRMPPRRLRADIRSSSPARITAHIRSRRSETPTGMSLVQGRHPSPGLAALVSRHGDTSYREGHLCRTALAAESATAVRASPQRSTRHGAPCPAGMRHSRAVAPAARVREGSLVRESGWHVICSPSTAPPREVLQ